MSVDKFHSFVILFILFSCSPSNPTEPGSGLQPVIFEVEYINFAWGYQHNGFYIFKDGTIHSYKFVRTDTAWRHVNSDYISEDELIDKFNHHDTLIGTVELDTLHWYRTLAESAAYDGYSDTLRTGADMGALSYLVYLYQPSLKKFRRMVLRTDGDWSFSNTSENAGLIVEWLKRAKK